MSIWHLLPFHNIWILEGKSFHIPQMIPEFWWCKQDETEGNQPCVGLLSAVWQVWGVYKSADHSSEV
jgi:hypothetical protein